MKQYIALRLWPESGVIESFAAEDDKAAVVHAKPLAREHVVELWEAESPRRIARFLRSGAVLQDEQSDHE